MIRACSLWVPLKQLLRKFTFPKTANRLITLLVIHQIVNNLVLNAHHKRGLSFVWISYLDKSSDSTSSNSSIGKNETAPKPEKKPKTEILKEDLKKEQVVVDANDLLGPQFETAAKRLLFICIYIYISQQILFFIEFHSNEK